MPFPENGGEINNYFQCFPLSSSEGDGSADEWKPTQNSEEEEEQVLQRGHKVPKRKSSESLVLQREVRSIISFRLYLALNCTQFTLYTGVV